VLGKFTVSTFQGDNLAGTLAPVGRALVQLSFVRFSTNPHP
jgi:hypothetical protein